MFSIPPPVDAAILTDTRDSTTSACTMPAAFSDFEDPMRLPCAGIGTQNVAGAPMRIADGKLHIEPRPNLAEGNACTVDDMALGNGVFVEVTQIFAHPNASVFFQILPLTPSEGEMAVFSAAGGGVGFSDGNSVPFDTSTHWWRLRPDPGNGRIVGEVSAEGESWQEVGAVVGLIPTRVKLVVGAVITDTGATTPGAAIFEHVNVCP